MFCYENWQELDNELSWWKKNEKLKKKKERKLEGDDWWMEGVSGVQIAWWGFSIGTTIFSSTKEISSIFSWVVDFWWILFWIDSFPFGFVSVSNRDSFSGWFWISPLNGNCNAGVFALNFTEYLFEEAIRGWLLDINVYIFWSGQGFLSAFDYYTKEKNKKKKIYAHHCNKKFRF